MVSIALIIDTTRVDALARHLCKGGHVHDGTAEETDGNHEGPAGDGADGPDGVAEGNVQLVLGEPAVGGVEGTLIGGSLLESLLGVNLVQLLGGDGGGVHVDDVERGRQTCLALRLGLGHLEVEDRGSTGGPSRAEHALFLTVQLTKVGGGGVGGEEEDGFLEGCDGGSAYMLHR